jgi:DNA-binding transcriptional LysR family regulator
MERLDLGTYESLAMMALPQLIASLKKDYPNLKLNLTIERSGAILQKLRSGEICTALVAETDGLESFQTTLVAEDELGLYTRTGLDDSWQTVESLGLGSISSGAEGHPLYYRKFLRSLGKIKPILTGDSFEVLRVAASSGHVVSILPKKVAQRSQNKLLEITARPPKIPPEMGRHKIVIAYLDRCDPEEASYLAGVVKKIL